MTYFSELNANKIEKPAMPFRMSRRLRVWVEVETDQQDIAQADDREIAAILRSFEQRGDAVRSLNRRGQVIWKPSPQLLEELAGAEQEAETEWENEK